VTVERCGSTVLELWPLDVIKCSLRPAGCTFKCKPHNTDPQLYSLCLSFVTQIYITPPYSTCKCKSVLTDSTFDTSNSPRSGWQTKSGSIPGQDQEILSPSRRCHITATQWPSTGCSTSKWTVIHVLPLLTALWKRKQWRCSNTSTHCRVIQLIRMAKTGSPLSCISLANSFTCSSIMSYQQNHYN